MSEKPKKKANAPPGAAGEQPKTDLILYQTEDGKTRLEVRLENDTVWLSQNQMTELFQTTKQNVSLHIQNVFEEIELERGATVKESLTVQQEGGRSVQRRRLEDARAAEEFAKEVAELENKAKDLAEPPPED